MCRLVVLPTEINIDKQVTAENGVANSASSDYYRCCIERIIMITKI